MSDRILVVEDDPALLATLEAAVAYGGFESRTVATGADALRRFAAEPYDAVLMDLGLPDMDGRELLGALRQRSDVPVLVVSGRASEADKIEALDLGADDYVPKPFLPGELLARIRAAIRRHRSAARQAPAGPSDRDPVRVGGFTIDPFRRTAELGGCAVALNPSEFTVLGLLAGEAGSVVSRQAVLAALYGDDPPPETRVVDVHISNIRKKLSILPEGEELIATYRGRGWMLRVPRS